MKDELIRIEGIKVIRKRVIKKGKNSFVKLFISNSLLFFFSFDDIITINSESFETLSFSGAPKLDLMINESRGAYIPA
jgi:hypothetical protein